MQRNSSSDSWPDWLEQKRVPDDLLEKAYESVPAPWRAALKTGLALAHFHFGYCDYSLECERFSQRLGFCERKHSTPVAWTMICIGSPLAAPARLCAALVLPLLAGVKNVFIVYVDSPPSPSDLVGIELCGIEDIFQIKLAELDNLLNFLASQEISEGRIIFFAGNEQSHLANLSDKHSIKHMNAGAKPTLLLLEPKLFDVKMIEFLHGFVPDTGKDLCKSWDCVYTATDTDLKKIKSGARLILGPGCEGFWRFDGFGPMFFINTSMLLDFRPNTL